MTKIRGNRDGAGGRNATYKLGSRKSIPRKRMVKEVEKKGLGAEVVKRKKRKYVRDRRDNSKKDNVNK